MTMGSKTLTSRPAALCDIYAILRLCICMGATCAGLGLCTLDVAADSIVYKGVFYEDVLVYKGSTSYYVKIPDEGRVFNVPNSEVNPSQVTRILDPYYRDELKLRFEDSKKRVQSGEILRKRDSGSSFSLADSDSEQLSASDFLERRTNNPGMGITLETVQTLLTSAGMTITKVAGITTATDSSGATTIKLYGPPESLTKIHVQSIGMIMLKNTVKQNFVQLQMTMAAFVPWTGPWLRSNMDLFNSGGLAEETRDHRRIEFSIAMEKPRLIIELTLESV